MEWQGVGILLSPPYLWQDSSFREFGLQGARVHELMFKQFSGLNEGSGGEGHECKWERRKTDVDHSFTP